VEKVDEKNLRFAVEKIEECEFFIRLAERHKTKPQEFGFYLSASLSAFYSILERLILTVLDRPLRKRKKRAEALARLGLSSPEIAFLLDARNLEVHHEGVHIDLVRRRDPLAPQPTVPRFGTRYGRFDDPLWTAPGPRAEKHWVFFKVPKSEAITLCRNALEQVQQLVSELAETGNRAKPG